MVEPSSGPTPSLHLRRWRACVAVWASARAGHQQTATGRPARTERMSPGREPDGLRERQAGARPAQFASRSSPGQGRASGVKCKALLGGCADRRTTKRCKIRFSRAVKPTILVNDFYSSSPVLFFTGTGVLYVEYQAYSFFNLGQCCCGNTVNVLVQH
jgi:hypothetical protein